MPVSREEILRSLMTRVGHVEEENHDQEGWFVKTLDVLNRPYSGVMGGITGVASPRLGVLTGIERGLGGEQQYGMYDLATEMGADPESKLIRYGSLVGDILNPLDPLLLVGGGFSKAAKVAKTLGKGTSKVENLADVATRASAARKGLWSPITIAGKAIGPRTVNVPLARAFDKVGEVSTRNRVYDWMARHLGGVRKFERDFPEWKFLKDGREDLQLRQEEFIQGLEDISNRLREKGMREREVNQVLRQASVLVERPKHMAARLQGEIDDIERELTTGKAHWAGPSERRITDGELAEYGRLGELSQREVDERIGELTRFVETAEGPSRTQGIRNVEGLRSARDELHVLKSLSVSKAGADVPPREVLLGRRHLLEQQRMDVLRKWDEAAPEAVQAAEMFAPFLERVKDVYRGRLDPLDKDWQFPIEAYLKHMFPLQSRRLMQRGKRASKAVEQEVQAEAERLMRKGWDGNEAQRAAERKVGVRGQLRGATADLSEAMRGDLTSFRRREYRYTIDEINQMFKDGELPFEFETHTSLLLDSMYRDANRWAYGYDAHKFVTEQPGWTIGTKDYTALTKSEQKGWVPMEFHVPWIRESADPFRGKYMRREVAELMDAQMKGVRHFSSQEGLNGLLQMLHGARRWWSSWTLAPFPSFHVRNLASDVILNHQGGLNPARDMMRMLAGRSKYGAALALAGQRSAVPLSGREWRLAEGQLEGLLGDLGKRYGRTVSGRDVTRVMEREELLGKSAIRDLDIDWALRTDPIVESVQRGRSVLSKGGDWIPLQRPERSKIIKKGFEEGQKVQDLPRTALFLHGLEEAGQFGAKTWDDAVEYATFKVRRHLFDYQDLTEFERSVMRLIVPFYTFTRNNLPVQISTALTDYGKMSWANRLYQGAWGVEEEDELLPEDLPEWLERELGLPLEKTVDKNGVETFAIWTPRSWLPQTELNELADLFRSEGMRQQLLSRVNPFMSKPIEQLLNRDAFTGREIDFGQTVEMMGVPVDPRIQHMIRNLRLVSELDRLNPGGVFSKVWEKLYGKGATTRPHRREAPEAARWVQFLTGMRTYGVEPVEETARSYRDKAFEANKAKGQARLALRKGQPRESQERWEEFGALVEQAATERRRLYELRKGRALKLAERERQGVS